MARIRTDNVFGTTTNAPLLVGGTTLNSAGLANLAVVTAPDIAIITLDPNRVNGAPEIVYVTAHTGAATSATVVRGKEGTAAREHPVGTFWVHAWTATDAGLGTLAYFPKTATDQTGITAITDLTGLSATVTLPADRRIRVTGYVIVQQSTNPAVVELHIREGATTLERSVDTLAAGAFLTCAPMLIATPTAGAHTYKLSLTSSAASVGTVYSTTGPAYILVEDIGGIT